ncbi:hypothetical protein LIER_04418 [Lithospermum erythrorhizon]|uniref:Uncharacterized protein n=1 Tax=Lithospermum erythrorhizon TaxID=34254 RepID=A0AAV3NX30_LITER
MDSVGKLRAALPQGDDKRPWYTFCDEALLVAASLVYDKVFSSQDKGQPPSWDEIANIAASAEPKLVDFNDMLMDCPSFFTRVAIVPQTNPLKSMVPEATSSSPPPTVNVPIPTIYPLLKRMAPFLHPCPHLLKRPRRQPPSKRKRPKSWRGKAVRKNQGEASAFVSPLPKYTSLYLAKPYLVPNLKVTNESPWGARKFHFHLARPLFSKEMAAQYTPLVDPYAAFAHVMKHINQAVNGVFVLARRADHLVLDNSSVKGVDAITCFFNMKKSISFKNNLNKELDREEAAKTWSAEKIQLEAYRDNVRAEKEALQLRYDELERAKADDIINALEVLAQTQRDAEMALASAAAKAETDRIQFMNNTLRSFISSLAYEKKMGSECATYVHSLVASTSERFPNLIALFYEEMAWRPDWYRGLTLILPEGEVLLEEGGETPNLPIEEHHPAKP